MAAGAWLLDWKKRIKLTIDSGDIDAALEDFPVLIYLSASSGIGGVDASAIFDELMADGNRKKIAVTKDDGTTELYVEIEKWDDANEKAWLWVKVSDIASGADTDLYLYYDVDHADNDTYVGDTNDVVAESVWDVNFKAVYHMADGVDNAHIYDSTSNDNDGAKKGANQPIEADGLVAKAQEFEGEISDDYITLPDSADFDIASGTVEALIWRETGASLTHWITAIRPDDHSTGWFYCNVATTLNSSNGTLYVDGVPSNVIGKSAWHLTTVSGITTGSSVETRIGARYNLLNNYFFDGLIGEIRISDIARSASWIKATKESLWDSLITFGSEQVFTPYEISIEGAYPEIRKYSRMVELRIEARSIAEFTVVDVEGILSYSKGQAVTINDSVSRIFGGFIDTVETFAMSPAGGLFHHIVCVDNHYLADKRLVAEAHLATAAGTIVSSIVTNYLADEGVTEGTIEAGPDIVEAVFNYVRASDVLDALAEKAGKIWYIDEYKKLYFVARTTTAAPWNAETSDITKNSIRNAGGNPLYRNRQYIRGGRDTTAEQTEDFVGDGSQFAFTVGYPIEKVPTSVKVNAVGQTIGIKGIDTAKDCYWNKGDATITFTVAPPAAQAVEVIYYGQYPILVLVEDANEIAGRATAEGGGTGYVEEIADEPTLNDKDASIDSGKAKLVRFGVAGKRVPYQVTRTGLRPGQLQTVNYPSIGLNNAELLIESVIVTRVADKFFYDVIGIQGPEMGGWSKFYKSLADQKQEVIDSLHIGSDQILIILADFTGNVEVSETISEPVITACEFPAADLYPGATLWPC